MVVLGIGTEIIGLRPPPSSSDAPSGIGPPLRVLDVVPGVENGEAVPPGETAADDAQAVDPADPASPVDVDSPADPLAVIPPASNMEPVPMVDDVTPPPVPAIPEFADPSVLQPNADNGLRPPGSIAVAPSGTPVGLFPIGPLEPSVVSGDANGARALDVPSPGTPIVVCASVAVQLDKSANAIIESRCIHVSARVVSGAEI